MLFGMAIERDEPRNTPCAINAERERDERIFAGQVPEREMT